MNLKTDFKKYLTKNQGISDTTFSRYTNSLTPYIMEERELNVSQVDVFSRLMMERIIFLGTDINDVVSNIIQAQLLYLESIDKDSPIQIYINSPGGSVYDGLGIYDTMQYIKPEVSTICTGLAASMAAVLLTSGAKGKRFILPHSRVMIHQVLSGVEGQSKDMEIHLQEVKSLGEDLYQILAKHSGNDIEVIRDWCDRDNWMKSDDAKKRGFVDKILKRNSKD